MLVFNKGQVNYLFERCQQCGSCLSVCPVNAITSSLRSDGLANIIVNSDKCVQCGKCVKYCSSNNNGKTLKKDYFEVLKKQRYYLGYNNDLHIRRESSSGGVARTLIIENLKSRVVGGVYSMKKTTVFPYVEGGFYSLEQLPEYGDIPTSIYHSVMIAKNINIVKNCGRLMLVGTSCQLKVMERALKGKYQDLIKICIFCKQQKTLDSTRFFAKSLGTKIPENLNFVASYRGDGWPGLVKIGGRSLPYGRAAQLPFGRRLWTVPGCNICGDPFGLEVDADITLMDPWKISKNNSLGETLIVVHTQKGIKLLQNTSNLTIEHKEYNTIEPALGLTDIRRKQQLVPYFLGETCSCKVWWAGKMEQLQRKYLQMMAMKLPRLPFIFYRIMCKIPDWRNIILK